MGDRMALCTLGGIMIVCTGKGHEEAMQRTVIASVWHESEWFVAQCLERVVASQDATEAAELANLREALEL